MKRLVPDQPLRAALYARVSSEQQQSNGTIASQLAALRQCLQDDGHRLADELCFVDDGFSGSYLIRPALERLRDAAALGTFERLYVLAPDRLARNPAHQAVLLDELQRAGVLVHFVNRPLGNTPEDQLLLQVQGVVAEYERAKILERSRRGKLHAAKSGALSVLGGAPYGYRYLSKHQGGPARYEVVWEQAQVVRQIFVWVGQERLSLHEVSRRLAAQGVPSPRGRPHWSTDTIRGVLRNRAYTGLAEYGKTRLGPAHARLRPRRGQGPVPRRSGSVYQTAAAERIGLAVPALVTAELFAQVAEQLAENQQRHRRQGPGPRQLLQGLVVCPRCGYACSARVARRRTGTAEACVRLYYRCNGTDRHRFAGQQICDNRPVRGDAVEAAVWQDVCALLQHPEKIEEEYRRRQEDPAEQRALARYRSGLVATSQAIRRDHGWEHDLGSPHGTKANSSRGYKRPRPSRSVCKRTWRSTVTSRRKRRNCGW